MTSLEHDLYIVCLHEAAHTKVAHRLGYAGTHFRIWRAGPGAATARAFNGRTYVFEDVRDDHGRIICLAGAVAELLTDEQLPGADIIHAWLQRGVVTLSEADAAGAEGFGEGDIRRTRDLVRHCWPEIEAEVGEWLACLR